MTDSPKPILPDHEPKLSVSDLMLLLSAASLDPKSRQHGTSEKMTKAWVAAAEAATAMATAATAASAVAMSIASIGDNDLSKAPSASGEPGAPLSTTASTVVVDDGTAGATGNGGNDSVAATTSTILARPLKKQWYTVTIGRSVGVFDQWTIVSPLVSGVSKACFAKHSSKAVADFVFKNAVNAGAVRVVLDDIDDSGDENKDNDYVRDFN